MSQQKVGDIITLPAASGSVPAYHILTVDSNGRCATWNTNTSTLLGGSQNNASSTGDAVGIALNGTTKIACGASVGAGVAVGAQTLTGKCVDIVDTSATTTTALPRVFGISLGAGSTNSVIEVAIQIVNQNRDASA